MCVFYLLFNWNVLILLMTQFITALAFHSLSPYPVLLSLTIFYIETYHLTLNNTILQCSFSPYQLNLKLAILEKDTKMSDK